MMQSLMLPKSSTFATISLPPQPAQGMTTAALLAECAQLQQENAQLKQKLMAQNTEAQATWDHLLMNLPSGVVILDRLGYVQHCNPAARNLFGQPLVHELWLTVITREFTPQADDGCEVSLRNGKRLHVTTAPLSNHAGQLLIFTDLTETRQLQLALNRHQRLATMGRMLASLAHQIRTPLAAAILYGANLGVSHLSATQHERFQTKLLASLQHLDCIIQDMLLFGGKKLPRTTQPLTILIDKVQQLAEHRLQLTKSSLKINCEHQETVVPYHVDGLASALNNCIQNAIDAAEKQAVITLELRVAQSNNLEISIQDAGPGMTEAQKNHAFEPFYTSKAKGTGLGLAVAKAVAEAHGGTISLHSTEGIGTEIIFQLPTTRGC